MGIRYLWDTNTVIYFLQKQFPERAEAFIMRSLKEGQPCVSAITEIELLCWNKASQKDLDTIHSFITDAMIIELEPDIKIKAAEIKKIHKLKLPDAIIAATALVYELTLITRNTKDFSNIPNLKIIDPHLL
jgi:predicted nucleic acid-binding protein